MSHPTPKLWCRVVPFCRDLNSLVMFFAQADCLCPFFSGRNVGRRRVRAGHAPGQHQGRRPRPALGSSQPSSPAFQARLLVKAWRPLQSNRWSWSRQILNHNLSSETIASKTTYLTSSLSTFFLTTPSLERNCAALNYFLVLVSKFGIFFLERWVLHH